MTDYQNPLGSGFDARSTASEVLAGLDLKGKRAIVTGGHSGLGLETTKALAEAGVDVLVAARKPDVAKIATRDIPGVEIDTLDLSDLASVHSFAARALASGRHVDMLINNAGIMACPETRVGPGWEAQFATNHLGHFVLTNLLWPLLDGGARVVALSSAAHHLSAIRWDDVQFEHGYDKWFAYGQSKTADALFAVHLDRLAHDRGVRAFSVSPGKILTPLQRYMTRSEMVAQGWIDEAGVSIDPTFKTPEQGAATQVWAATSPQLDGLGGLYCKDCDVAIRAEDADAPFVGVKAYAADGKEAEKLWRLSVELTNINAF
ncbi:SDR family NAD(P)-dependent oxidoreductase [Sphingobium sp. H39-3-25]|uniref:SDR family NAD(P)-dependent oxidoreductase n=1 Tax=Sphingomonadales TaxID=204457 RepID=UPI000834BBB3|nr:MULTISPECIES: SDR family NAD(P)-dependent oxidoreductase [Sphingomonadaceae]MDF0491096.1 SDR family NAD(P)-dependent oxidoreductase [Sphingomonas pollutisoli]MDF0545173.1 SDR family NAD(P)-dependent oxidoreductase [Sphingobium arseniciresistens]